MRCKACGKTSYVLLYEDSNALCIPCYKADLALRKDAIQKLPDVSDVAAPLGYHQVYFDYNADELKGRAMADYHYQAFWGMRN